MLNCTNYVLPCELCVVMYFNACECSISTGPGRISLSHSSFDQDNPLDEFQYFSDGK